MVNYKQLSVQLVDVTQTKICAIRNISPVVRPAQKGLTIIIKNQSIKI